MRSEGLQPRDLIDVTKRILIAHRTKWLGPEHVWEELIRIEPDLAAEVTNRVNKYKNPMRNNEVWFVSNTLYHLHKLPGFRVSNTEEVQEMHGKAYWLLARAE